MPRNQQARRRGRSALLQRPRIEPNPQQSLIGEVTNRSINRSQSRRRSSLQGPGLSKQSDSRQREHSFADTSSYSSTPSRHTTPPVEATSANTVGKSNNPTKGKANANVKKTNKRNTHPKGIPYQPYSRALQEIKHHQSNADLLIPKAPFSRVVREIMQTSRRGDYKFQQTALEALQCAAEAFLTGLFEDTNLITLNRRQITIMPRDIILALRIRGDR